MSPFGFDIFGLLEIPLLAGQWIGVIGFGRARKDAAWRCMAYGTGLQSLMVLIQITITVIFPLLTGFHGNDFGNPHSQLMSLLAISYAARVLGALLFFVGLALTGWQAGRRKDRITELELMNLAQATELERLRNR